MLNKDYKIPDCGKPSIFVGERQSSAKKSSISGVINKSLHKLRGLVTTASDALLVCRLDAQFLDADLVCFLALCGIPFCTLLAKPLMPPFIPYPDVDIYLPQCPSGYRFTKVDYEAYLNC